MLNVFVCIEQEKLQIKYIEYLQKIQKEQQSDLAIEVFSDTKQLLFECSDKEKYADIILVGTVSTDELQVVKELRQLGVDAAIVLLIKDITKAVEAFDLNVLRCIDVEDMDWEKQCRFINSALQRCEEQMQQHIVLKTREETCKIMLKDIHYFEMAHHKITVYYQRRGEQPQEFTFGGSIGKLANILEDKGFLYPNSAQLVAKASVKQLVKGKLILHNGMEINISKIKRNEIKDEMAK